MITNDGHGEGEFIRGFFRHVDAKAGKIAALHGWRKAFDDAASDVDLVVDAATFGRLPSLMAGYCEEHGWRLIQLFPHEDTALYGICVNSGDPRRVVALDVCSDYQRNGVVYLGVEELLEDRIALDWGGWCLPPGHEFRYRFAKAAAKGKAAESLAEDLDHCPDEGLLEACSWLSGEWRITVRPEDLRRNARAALAEFAAAARRRQPGFRPRTWARWFGRFLNPTGLVVEWPGVGADDPAKQWARESGARYFRRGKATNWSPRLLGDVARSSLIVCPRVPAWLKNRQGIFLSGPVSDEQLVDHLAQRLRSRLQSR